MARQEGSSLSLTAVVAVSAITSAVVCGAILLGVSAGGSIMDTEPRPVPDLSGLTAAGAGSVLRDARLSLIVSGEEYDARVPEGEICRQEPRAGSQVPPDTVIHVWSSLGPEPADVPDLVGQSLEAARAALTQAGLSAGSVTEEAGPGAPGSVVRTTPAANETLERGGTVDIVARPATVMVEVPNLVGQSSRRARELIVQSGFVVGQERIRFDDIRAPYAVLSQEPAAATMAPQGSPINLVINEGD